MKLACHLSQASEKSLLLMLLIHLFYCLAQIMDSMNCFHNFLVLLKIVLCDLILYLAIIKGIYVLWIKDSFVKIHHTALLFYRYTIHHKIQVKGSI